MRDDGLRSSKRDLLSGVESHDGLGKIVINKAVLSSDEMEETQGDLYKTCGLQRHHNDSDSLARSQKSTTVVRMQSHSSAGDTMFPVGWSPHSDYVSSIRTSVDTQLQLRSALLPLMPACRSCPDISVNFNSSRSTVRENVPINAEVAAFVAQRLHCSSAELLCAYQRLKCVVRQRIYRRFYVKWMLWTAEAQSSSSPTQESTERRVSSSTAMGSSCVWDVATPVSRADSPCSSALPYPLANVSAVRKDSVCTAPRGSSLLPSLRSKSMQPVLVDFGRRSTSPQPSGAQRISSPPSTRLPVLV